MKVEDFKEGKVLIIDKPLNWTSFQVVNKIRWAIRKKFNLKKIKVGHAGTLDPLATGLLVICTGKMTKKIDEFQAEAKEYTGTITLGKTTPSFDLETEIDKEYPTDHITEKAILETAASFKGISEQKPPLYSAIKKDGVRLYELARKGEQTEIKSRKIEIFEFEIEKIEFPKVFFRIVCSKGTYIRSIASDFGIKLKSGAHLSSLRRTKSGNFDLSAAETPESFVEKLKKEGAN
ncbi:tRNA pseudouridine(55) synthase TruB [Lutimonas zeaxanthinifaciens]|uniref:tRNA pseudouridine(55) synthase TruB n=1 Tax=Lutimonas zeaxanthinifaciens TaxID=3060215 RepID=UPI00265D43F3|nr:tRNA pseudouridine(55) synthase TruB [Lutimonas sp. YSD2104]WKK66594.1 tRNA pseudouridine(55) synthase TruB [Lutimonas sp. YSD2104]